MALVTKKTIEDFYSNKMIAVIGASRKKSKFGGMLLKELLARNYEAIPVNPHAESIQGKNCFKTVKDIPEKIDVAIAVVPAQEQEKVVLESAEAGIKTLWLHEHIMKGVTNPKAVYLCEEKGLNCIVGFCPLMFLPKTGFPHNIHRTILKVFKALPK